MSAALWRAFGTNDAPYDPGTLPKGGSLQILAPGQNSTCTALNIAARLEEQRLQGNLNFSSGGMSQMNSSMAKQWNSAQCQK